MRNFNKKKSAKFDKRQALLLFVILALVIGLIIGTIMCLTISQSGYNELRNNIQNYFNSFFNGNVNSFSLFKDSFIKYISPVIIIWFLAFVKIGGILIFLVILLRGLSYSYTTTFFITVYGLSGIAVAGILYFVQFIILVPTYLYLSYKSINYNLFNRNLEKVRDIKSLLMYFKILIIGAASVVIVSAVEAFIIPILIFKIIN